MGATTSAMLQLKLIFGWAVDVASYAQRAPAHWRLCRYMSEQHAERGAVSLRCLAETEDYIKSPDAGGPYYGPIVQRVPQYRHQAEYHVRMRQRWARIACQPWRSLRALLEADLKDQPADAIWRTLEYGFPTELSKPVY